jgi:AbrB family looped-hinge helix DNA binding protein
VADVKTVTVSETGRLTLPADVRRALGLEGETELEVEIDERHDAIILRPAVVLRRGDAWAYTPEHRDLLARAHADSREGRVRELSEADLERLGS